LTLKVNAISWTVALTIMLSLTSLPITFKGTFSCNDPYKAETLKRDIMTLPANYNGLPLIEAQYFDDELVSNTIANLKRGNAADIEGISAVAVLSSLFARSSSQTFSVDDLFLLHPRRL